MEKVLEQRSQIEKLEQVQYIIYTMLALSIHRFLRRIAGAAAARRHRAEEGDDVGRKERARDEKAAVKSDAQQSS